KIRNYYTESAGFIPEVKKRQRRMESKLSKIDEAAKDIPSLL
ncbi:unnamed protein product, partial [marine sediment metagenome]